MTLAGNNSFRGKKVILSGGLIAEHDNALGNTQDNKWLVQEKGWIASHVHRGSELLKKVDTASTGVLALSANTAEQLDLSGHKNLSLGAESGKTIEYGAKGTTEELQAVDGSWRLGGGGGILNVNFVLADGVDAKTGEVIKHDLIVGNEYSNGTVHLTNSNNSFSGIIYIKGTGNLLTYESLDALGDARVSIEYGNILALHKESDLYLINADTAGEDGTLSVGAKGILATVSSFDLDISNYSIALGAVGEQTYTSKLTVDEAKGYRLGGSGSLIMDTTLDCSSIMQIDGQGNSGSSVTFARAHAYTGSITAGGMLEKDNMTGDIGIHAGYGNTFASVTSMELQKGAILYTDGHADMVVHNLSARNDSSIRNNGTSATNLELNITEASAIGDNVLADANNSAGLTLVKKGEGTLTMGSNNSWSGGLVIAEGKVIASAGASGIGAAGASIHVEKGASLSLTLPGGTGYSLGSGLINQVITGTGTVEISSGRSVVFSQQKTAFEGTIKLDGYTRMYVGNMNKEYNNLGAFNSSTVIDVAKGSQVRVTNSLRYMSTASVETTANFAIEGTGFAGSDAKDGGGAVPHATLNVGALSIDCGAVVLGNVTLNGDATIASWSSAPRVETAYINTFSTAMGYGVQEKLGGTIRGLILGVDKDLTIAGNESMTITADSANDFRNLIIDNKQLDGNASNGSNTDKFALRLDGGKAVSQVSTALGTGQVDLRSNLILRLAGTGTPGQSDVVYTYDNAIMVGDNATLQSYNITNELTNQVIAGTGTLNLATAEGGVLHLAGGVSGTGLLNIAAGSDVRLGGAKATFQGNVQAAAGAKLTLDSAAALDGNSTITGIDSLTLCLGNGGDYFLGGIKMEKSSEAASTALTLRFDFTGVPSESNTDSWSSLDATIEAGELLVGIDLNMYDDVQKGDYVLIDDIGDLAFSLVEGSSDRLSLSNEGGKLVLHVAPDGRLIWTRGNGSPQSWDSTNWYSEEQDKMLTHTSGTDVLLSARAAEGASPDACESIALHSDVTVGSMMVRDAAYSITGDHKLTGKELVVGSGAELKLSTAQAEFTNGVLVNGANLSVEESELKANITAENFASVSLKDSMSTGDIQATNASISLDASSVSGELTLSISELAVANQSSVTGNVNLSYSSASISDSVLEGNINIGKSSSLAMEKANLKGKIQIGSEGSIITASNSNTEANAWATLSGNLSDGGSCTLAVSSGSIALNGKVSLKSLSMADGESVRFYNDTDSVEKGKRIDRLELGRNGTLEVYNNAGQTCYSGSIGTLQVNEVASVKDIYNSGYLKIESLELAEGTSSGILNLVKNSGNYGASYTTIYELGSGTAAGGNFAGVVELSNTKANNGNHSVFITLAGKDILANAAVKMNSQASSDGYLGLGIMADGATIGGLESSLGNRALLFSGESKQNCGWNLGNKEGHQLTNNSTVRTLVIDTDAGTDYAFNGRVFNNLNIVKKGKGTQAFNGISTGFDNTYNFDGSIELQEGTLIFGKDAISMLTNASSVTIRGGTLDISSHDFNASDSALEINNFTFSEKAVLALGNLNQGTTYEFFGSSGIFLTNWTDLTTDNFTINGVSLSDMGHVVNLVLNMGGSFSYTIDSWDLVWNGSSEQTVWNQDETSKQWQATHKDSFSDMPITEASGFINNDNVAFESDANLKLEGDIRVNNLSVADDVTLKTEGKLDITGDLTIGKNVSWEFSGDTTLSFTEAELQSAKGIVVGDGATLAVTDVSTGEDKTSTALNKVSGTGDVMLHLKLDNNNAASGNGVGFNFSGISGDVIVSAGRLQVNTSVFHEDSTIRLAAANSELVFNATTELKNDIVLDAASTIHVNGNGDKNSTISGDITGAGTLIKHGGSKLTLTGNSTIGDLQVTKGSVEINGTLNLTNTKDGTATISGISGTGTLGLNFSANYANKLAVADGFTGTTHVQKGYFTLNGSKFGNTLRLADGVEVTTTSGSNVTMDKNLILDGVSRIHQTDNANITYNGSVTGTGTYARQGGGTLQFNKEVNLGGFTQSGGTTYFNGTTVLGTVNQSGGIIANNGTTNITGRFQFNGSGDLQAKAGELTLSYAGTDGNSVYTLDGSMSGNARGTVKLAENVSVSATYVYGTNGSEIHLANGARLKHNNSTEISNQGTGVATLKSTGNAQVYNINNGTFELANAHIKTSKNDVELKNKLINSSVENAGAGTLTINNGGNTLTGLHATGGNINVAAAASLDLTNLVIDVQKSITSSAAMSVNSLAQFESGATLNADLTLATGATVNLGGEDFTLNGALTLQTGLTLGGNALEAVKGLAVGESYTLFSGVTNLQLEQAVTLNNMRSLAAQKNEAVSYKTLMNGVQASAADYFRNLSGNTGLMLSYNSTDGSVSITLTAAIPEPATSTLSLLALSALAARRRRK